MIRYLLLLTVFSSFTVEGYDKYCNARYGYCIEYPANLMKPAQESTNGDGCIFYTATKQEILRVYGSIAMDVNGEPLTIRQQYQMELDRMKKDSIQYKRVSSSYFVISGITNGKIFYEKAVMKEDAFAFARMIYSKTDKDKIEKELPKIFASFK